MICPSCLGTGVLYRTVAAIADAYDRPYQRCLLLALFVALVALIGIILRSVTRRHLLRVAALTWLFLRVALATCIGVWVGFAAVWEVGARWL